MITEQWDSFNEMYEENHLNNKMGTAGTQQPDKSTESNNINSISKNFQLLA